MTMWPKPGSTPGIVTGALGATVSSSVKNMAMGLFCRSLVVRTEAKPCGEPPLLVPGTGRAWHVLAGVMTTAFRGWLRPSPWGTFSRFHELAVPLFL